MTPHGVNNLAHSVHQRLLNRARQEHRPFSELLQRYAMERFLHRLSCSEYADRFVLKGALLLTIWKAPESRPTMDIDLLGKVENTPERMVDVFRSVCETEVPGDGLDFNADSVAAHRIQEQAEYEGVRVRLGGALGTARVRIQVDIGFGDVIVPGPTRGQLPTLLDFPAPILSCYSRESVVAEKLHPWVRLGILNSRMKDIWDLLLLSTSFEFDGPTLVRAVQATFTPRGTAIIPEPEGLSPLFAEADDKQRQWGAFLHRSALEEKALSVVVEHLAHFLLPVLAAAAGEESVPGTWPPGGPWSTNPQNI